MAHNLRTLSSYQCTNHTDREGIGVCVGCRNVFCAECSTKIDGVNYCNSCLRELSAPAEAKPRKVGQIAQTVFALCFVVVIFISLVSVGVGVGLMVPSIRRVKIRAKAGENLKRLTKVKTALKDFNRDTGRYPTEEEGLAVLVADERNEVGNEIEGWNGPYLWEMGTDWEDKSALDAYGAPIEYVVTKSGDWLIASRGPDGVWNSPLSGLAPPDDKGDGDDVVMWIEQAENEKVGK